MLYSFLDDLLQIIKVQSITKPEGVDLALIGNLLMRDRKHWREHGYVRLSSAVAALEQRGKVRIFRHLNGALRVQPVTQENGGAVAPVEAAKLPTVTSGAAFQSLRSIVWYAFAVSSGSMRQERINRRTGKVWTSHIPPPPPELDWVAVEPVPEEQQKRWALEVIDGVEESHHRDVLNETLKQPDWFRQFPFALRRYKPGLVKAWSQIRSAGIVEQVRAWAGKNNVPEELLFLREGTQPHEPRPIVQTVAVEPGTPPPVADLRHILIQALGLMGTDDLLSLPIPPRLLLKAARPDLLM